MKVVWKFELKPDSEQTVEMPTNAHLLSVGIQSDIFGNEKAVVWAIVDPTVPMVKRSFWIRATGEPLHKAEEGDYVGKFVVARKSYVFHVFVSKEES